MKYIVSITTHAFRLTTYIQAFDPSLPVISAGQVHPNQSTHKWIVDKDSQV